MSVFFYILAISFQIAGAIQLAIYSMSAKRENVVKRFAQKTSLIIDNGDTSELDYDDNAFLNEFKLAWFNKISFFYIAVGYIIGIWGDLEDYNKFFALLWIISIVIFIMIISYFFINKINQPDKITNNELEKLGLSPDIRSVSEKEIDELFENNFLKKD